MTNVTESNKLRIINMIRDNKGIRTPELVDRLEIENPQPYIAGEIEREEILVEKVLAADNAHTVNSYSINPDNPPDVLLSRVNARCARPIAWPVGVPRPVQRSSAPHCLRVAF
ncbi:hypothetical protein AXI85_gp15 [Ralstonia phage RS138]|uniref:hypothetical protein n=1 Tax=Ralstonia phage RS138 TaxID=1483485 RepID=UPI0006BC2F2C|nr:hypothetical protein AXI85_gp15 [Ralstonia phage RS138]BAS32813.1 hypothetical protein [Ralstonia phage RS138]